MNRQSHEEGDSSRSLAAIHRELIDSLLRFAPVEGLHPSPWPGLAFFRAHRSTARLPVVYEPCLCVVAQGSKRAFSLDQTYVYDPLHYLVLGVPLPLEAQIVEASAERPFLSLKLDLNLATLSDLLLDMEGGASRADTGVARSAVYSSRMSVSLGEALVRFLRAVEDSRDRRILAPLAVREVLYRVLTGEQADQLRAVAVRDSRAQVVARVLRFLQRNLGEPLDVPALAAVAGMSPSAFHHAFKAVTSASPMQYLKKVRLHQARQLMLHQGARASEAAYRVGYGSPSQFSREFKRLFGASPRREVERARIEAGATG